MIPGIMAYVAFTTEFTQIQPRNTAKYKGKVKVLLRKYLNIDKRS